MDLNLGNAIYVQHVYDQLMQQRDVLILTYKEQFFCCKIRKFKISIIVTTKQIKALINV